MLRNARWIMILGGLALGGLSIAEPALAQQRGPERRNQLEQRVRQRFNQTIRVRLDLTNDELRELGATLEPFQEVRADIAGRRRRARARVRMLGQTDRGGAELTDEAAIETLTLLADLADAEAKLYRDEQDALLEILTPAQVLLFTRLRDQLNERVRRLRQNPGGPGQLGRGAVLLLPGNW